MMRRNEAGLVTLHFQPRARGGDIFINQLTDDEPSGGMAGNIYDSNQFLFRSETRLTTTRASRKKDTYLRG